jgi:hypothetical protein
MVCACDDNILDENKINERSTESLLEATKNDCVGINLGKTN